MVPFCVHLLRSKLGIKEFCQVFWILGSEIRLSNFQINFNFQPPSSKLIMSDLSREGAAQRSGGTPEIWTMRSVWKLSLVLEIYLEIVG